MWTPFNFLIGAWQGSGQGRPGHSHVERKYEFVLNKKFLFVQNESVYDPQEKNPNGEIHEDWGLISYDRAKETYVFRQFHKESYQILGPDEFIEVFKLAGPGKEFKVYTENRFQRIRSE